MDASSITEFQIARLKRESQEKENTAITAYACYFTLAVQKTGCLETSDGTRNKLHRFDFLWRVVVDYEHNFVEENLRV